MWRTVQKGFLAVAGGGAACCLLILLLSSGLQADSVDTTYGGVNVRIFVVRGTDNVIYYTFYQLKTTPATSAGAFGANATCTGNRFTLDSDTNSNRWPDSSIGATPFRQVPGGASAAGDPNVHLTASPVAETGLLVSVRGNDSNIYWTILDLDCDQTYAVPTFFTTAFGFGDTDDDGWPGATTTSLPWLKAEP